MDMDEVEAGIPEMKLRRMTKRLIDRYDSLMEQEIHDQDLFDTIKMMREQLGMLTAQSQQAIAPPTAPVGGTPTGASVRPPRSPVPGVPT